MAYEEGFHIPPGGNYFAKTTFVTGPHAPLHCHMIATAFADFRTCILWLCVCSCACACVCVRASARMRMSVRVRACLSACVGVCVHACVVGSL